MIRKFKAIEAELNGTYLERREVIRGLMVGLLAKQHVCEIGAPGGGKSALADDLCSRIGGEFFDTLLARTSTPEEILGPLNIAALEQGRYERVTDGTLITANIAFIDEIWKCNSAVLNGMLKILNERKYKQGRTMVNVPLAMAIGASNELPEDREELGALWDRFGLRYIISYIKDPRNFEALLAGAGSGQPKTTIDMKELMIAQNETQQVDISRIITQITKLRGILQGMNIPVSDRRWKQSLALVKANAWIEGRTIAADDDLEILVHALWQDPGQIPQVRQAIMELANPLDQEALDLHDQALEIWQNAMNAGEETASKLGTEANAKLKKITKRLQELQTAAQTSGKSDTRIAETLAATLDFNKQVIGKCLGITL